MDAQQEGPEAQAFEGPLVVGAESPVVESARPRRDQSIPPAWVSDPEPGFSPDDYAAPPVPVRTVKTLTLIILGLLVLFLVGMLVDFAMAVAQQGASAGLALGFLYGTVIQFLGWWTVIHVWRRR